MLTEGERIAASSRTSKIAGRVSRASARPRAASAVSGGPTRPRVASDNQLSVPPRACSLVSRPLLPRRTLGAMTTIPRTPTSSTASPRSPSLFDRAAARRLTMVWRLAMVVALALLLAVPICAASAAAGQQATGGPSVEPPNLRSARDAVAGFLDATGRGDFSRAAAYLDLRRLPEASRAQEGPVLARQL